MRRNDLTPDIHTQVKPCPRVRRLQGGSERRPSVVWYHLTDIVDTEMQVRPRTLAL